MATHHRLVIAVAGILCFAGPCARGQDAELAKKINEAIDKGVAYVKNFSDDGDMGTKRPASWALRGWALLEAGVPANDADVKRLVDYVRQEVPEMDGVYDVALSLIFLDKLGDQGDKPLIESLAARLLAAQGNRGGWGYSVPRLHRLEKARLSQLIIGMERLRSQGLAIKFRARAPQEVSLDIARQLRSMDISGTDFGGDNSNTQFAMIAIWVARRHNVPVFNSLQQVEKRFQVSQIKTGHWGYEFPAKAPPVDDTHFTYPAMTCAGLLGLALGEGVRAKPRNLLQDMQVQRGLEVLARTFAEAPPAKRANYHYYLFSMERVAVVYNLKKIGDEDWYLWGARKLVDTQDKDGSWNGGHFRDGADACFALLFLKRANVAKDLTEILGDPIRKGPGNRRPEPKKVPDNLFDPPNLLPKKTQPTSHETTLAVPTAQLIKLAMALERTKSCSTR